MDTQFKIGDRVKVIKSPMLSEESQRETIGRTGRITNISIPVGTAVCLTVEWDEPFVDEFGYKNIRKHYYETLGALKKINKDEED